MISITFHSVSTDDTVSIVGSVHPSTTYYREKLINKVMKNFSGDMISYSGSVNIVHLNLVIKSVTRTDYENFRSFLWDVLNLNTNKTDISAITNGDQSFDIGTGSGNSVSNAQIEAKTDEDFYEAVPPFHYNLKLPFRWKET